MAEKNHEVIEAFFQAVFNRGDTDAADRYIESTFLDYAPWPGHPATLAGFKAGLAELRNSFPDLRVTVERTVAQDDLVVGHLRMSGTQLGAFRGAAASGKTFGIEAIDIMRIQAGRIVEHWGVIDEAGIARQLGISA